MGEFLKTLFKGIGTTVKFLTISTGIIIVTIGGICYMMKPENKTFRPYLKNFIGEIAGFDNDSNFFERGIKNIFTSGAERAYNTDIKDYLILKIADVHAPAGEHIYFIGAFQNWCPVNKLVYYFKN